MDLNCVPASPGSRWMGESAARRRQRCLSSPSLRAYLTPAFDAVAAGEGGTPGSSSSSGGLDLRFDASLLRFRRACISASTDLDGRLLLYSPQLQQARAVYPAMDDEVLVAGGGRYDIKLQGGKILIGGSAIESEGNFVQPTIVEISPSASVVRDELFGPVLYVMKFQTLKEAIEINNSVPQQP